MGSNTDPRVEMVLCFLCTDFANTVIWESWRADDDADSHHIGFVTHPRPENKWFVPYSVAEPEETRWGDCVWAELYLLAESLVRFPNARQLLLVSGDTVPIRTKEDFVDFFLADDMSTVTLFEDVFPVRRKDLNDIEMNKMYNGHQFMALHRKHAEYLVSSSGINDVLNLANVDYYTKGYEGTYNPDEVYLQTILGNRFPVEEFFNHRFVEVLADGTHAKTLSPEEFQSLYVESIRTDTLFCVRKVTQQTQWPICRFLGEMGVINYHPEII